jgi:hypothetical protein
VIDNDDIGKAEIGGSGQVIYSFDYPTILVGYQPYRLFGLFKFLRRYRFIGPLMFVRRYRFFELFVLSQLNRLRRNPAVALSFLIVGPKTGRIIKRASEDEFEPPHKHPPLRFAIAAPSTPHWASPVPRRLARGCDLRHTTNAGPLKR